jgi:HAD superfamily phosphoserine phosphatase-like hydrolase
LPPERVVIWDIDGTLVAPSLERLFLGFLTDRGLVQPWQGLGRLVKMWVGGLFPPWYRLKLAYLRGEREAEVADWIEQCFDEEIRPRLYPGATASVRLLRERKVPQLLLSGTLERLAQRLARYLDVDHVSAARPEISGGRYTGALIEPHPHGRIKVARARTWLKQNHIAWEQVTACADHFGDRYLLQEAGQAIAVNARPELKRHAQRQGWAVASDRDLPEIIAAGFV